MREKSIQFVIKRYIGLIVAEMEGKMNFKDEFKCVVLRALNTVIRVLPTAVIYVKETLTMNLLEDKSIDADIANSF